MSQMTILCQQCKIPFEKRSHNHVCCAECAAELRKARKRKEAATRRITQVRNFYSPRACQVCGKSYFPRAGNQKTCGGSCTSRSNLEHKRELRRLRPSPIKKAKRLPPLLTLSSCSCGRHGVTVTICAGCGNPICGKCGYFHGARCQRGN